ncbi:MAG: type VI secretion system tip protein TssI/VgrG, partial [Polyangiales bacterium]
MFETFVKTDLGDKALMLHGLTGREALSQPYSFSLTLVNKLEDPPINQAALLGTVVKVTLDDEYSADPRVTEKPKRYFNGYVTRSVLEDVRGEFRIYRVELRPWLWLLDKTSNCRVFQNKTVPEIVQEVFRKNGFTDFTVKLGTYKPREYCVQYRESDLAFVSRLLEHEGIYYYFEFAETKHTLVLADGTSP